MRSTHDAASLAKQALMEMALGKIAPTPENFKAHYDKRLREAGGEPDARGLDPAGSRKAENQARSLIGVVGIVEAFVTNLAALFPENPLLQEQLIIVRDALAAPDDLARLTAARKSLSRLRSPDIHSHLSAAKIVAQQMTEQFLDQMGAAGDATAEIELSLFTRQEAISEAANQSEVDMEVCAMLADATRARGALGEAKDRMDQTRQRAQEAQAAINELEHQLIKASEEAKRDYLTGLLNRRGLDEALEAAYRDHHMVSVALLDVDNFKALNDELGHQAGDEALKALSCSISEILAGSGSPARMGGEEFLLLFPNLTQAEAAQRVESLQRALTKKIYVEAQGSRFITFSAGVASRREGESPSETIARADQAMYSAKRLGKNRVELAD